MEDVMQLTELGFSVGILVFIMVFNIILLLPILFFYYKIFEKAGKTGWHAFIPFYNTYLQAQISFGEAYWYLMLPLFIGAVSGWLAPLVWIYSCYWTYSLAKSFDADNVVIMLCILIPVVGYGILALNSKYVYGGPVSCKLNNYGEKFTNEESMMKDTREGV